MARKAKAKKDWSKTNGALLSGSLKDVGELMEGNPSFKTPAVNPADMGTQSGSMLTAYNNRKLGLLGKETYKTALADSNAMMDKQAEYVSEIADGNVEMIASAGFRSTLTTSSKKIVPMAPQPPVLLNVNGELSMRLKRVKGASSYCYLVFIGELSEVTVTNGQIDVDPKSKVIIIPAGTTRECARGLVTGTKVWVMALAQNSAGKSGFSPAVSIGIA